MVQPPARPPHRRRSYRQLPHPLEAESPTQRVQRVPSQQLSDPVVVEAPDANENDEGAPTQPIPRVRLRTKQLSPAGVPGTAHAETADAGGAAAEPVETDRSDTQTAEVETADADRADTETAEVETAKAETADADRADTETAEVETAKAETADADRADADLENADTLRMPRVQPASHQIAPDANAPQQVITPLPVQKPADVKRFGFLALGVTTLAALLIGALLGSSRNEVTATPQPTATVTATATATVSNPTSEPSKASTDAGAYDQSNVVKFDKYHAYTDGLEASVTSARRSMIPPFTAGGNPGDPMVIVTVKIKNDRKKSFDTDIVSVNLAYGASGMPAKSVLVPGMEGLSGTIAKGRSQSAEYAFAVPNKSMNKIVIVINRGLKYGPAIFAGKAK
jgi:hypothetical protein